MKDQYILGVDLAKAPDVSCCVVLLGKTIVASFTGDDCEEQAKQWCEKEGGHISVIARSPP